MTINKNPFGKIIYHENDYSNFKEIIRITGVSDKKPSFVNRFDRKFWNNYWKNRSERFGIVYLPNQNKFDKSYTGLSSGFFKDEVDSITFIMNNLLESYSNSAGRYDAEIARKSPEERKNLSDILEI